MIFDVGRIAIGATHDPTPLTRCVVIRVSACGRAGADLYILHSEFVPTLRIVPSHEYADEVVAAGGNGAALKIRERLAAVPKPYCFVCNYCRLGRNNFCERRQATGATQQRVPQSTSLCPQPTVWCRLPRSEPRTPLSSSRCRARSEAMTLSGNSSYLRG